MTPSAACACFYHDYLDACRDAAGRRAKAWFLSPLRREVLIAYAAEQVAFSKRASLPADDIWF